MIKNIILDFGHGGLTKEGIYTTAPNKMAILPNGKTMYEGVINRQIGGLVYRMLNNEFPTLNIVCTVKPSDPRDISLSYRTLVANRFDKDETIFISIHSNAFNGRARGFEIYTTRGVTKSDTLAEYIADEVEELYNRLELKLRYDFSDGDKDKEADFYVLRKTKCPAVLLECLFFDNIDDAELLTDLEFQKEFSFKVVQGIKKFIKNN